MIADLHNHSHFSDGEISPTKLVELAAAKDLEAVALTDHDTIAGLDEALAAGRRCKITVIPGIELTLRFKRPEFTGSLHLLLYFSAATLANDAFRDDLQELCTRGRGPALVRARVAAINQHFGPASRQPLLQRNLEVDELDRLGENITRRHFARVLAEQHQLESDTVNRIIANQSPAYLPSGLDPAEFTPLRRKYPFLAFLAHPAAGSFPPPSHYREVLPPWPVVAKLLPEFTAPEPITIDGLESEYPGHLPEHQRLLRRLAQEQGLLLSGGSDGHDRHRRPYGVCGLESEDYTAFTKAFQQLANRSIFPAKLPTSL